MLLTRFSNLTFTAAAAAVNGSSGRALLQTPCFVPPPPDCNGHGTVNMSACTCNCTAGYVNDFTVSDAHDELLQNATAKQPTL
jgi:hypothetical protein